MMRLGFLTECMELQYIAWSDQVRAHVMDALEERTMPYTEESNPDGTGRREQEQAWEGSELQGRMFREGREALGPPDGSPEYTQRLADWYYAWIVRNNVVVEFTGPKKELTHAIHRGK